MTARDPDRDHRRLGWLMITVVIVASIAICAFAFLATFEPLSPMPPIR